MLPNSANLLSDNTPQRVRTSLYRYASMIAPGFASVSTLALLAVGSIIPLFTEADAAPAITWLGGLGAKALTSWLDQWARANLARALGDDPDTEWMLLEQMARDLQDQIEANHSLAVDVATLLERTQAIPIAVEALQGQGAQQTRLLRLLLEDLQHGAFRNERLYNVALRAVVEQGKVLRDVIEHNDAALLAMIPALLPSDTTNSVKLLPGHCAS